MSTPAPILLTFGEPLPGGPTGRNWGDLVARVLMDSIVVATVEGIGAYGNDVHVRLSDGTMRRRSLGRWYLVEKGSA